MNDRIRRLLDEDVRLVCEALAESAYYAFPEELKNEMKSAKLSSSALAERIGSVSHTAVDKWLRGDSRPGSREKMKALGMALGMDEKKLNLFLIHNGYPGLFMKNPLDAVAVHLLQESAGRKTIVALYRTLLEKLSLNDYAPPAGYVQIASDPISRDLREMSFGETNIREWQERYAPHFTAGAKQIFPLPGTGAYLRRMFGGRSVTDVSLESNLPLPVTAMVYLLLAEKALSVRGLREKIIALCLFMNCTAQETDAILLHVRNAPLAQMGTRTEKALEVALFAAHDRYPLYEMENLEMQMRSAASKEEEKELSVRMYYAQQRADYYEARGGSPEDLLFEERYTSKGGGSLADYMQDILALLVEKNVLSKQETKPFWTLLAGGDRETR